MKLNYDCLRDVLIGLESKLSLNEELGFNILDLDDVYKFDNLADYSKEDIYYCIHNLKEIGFIDSKIIFADGGIPFFVSIANITYSGHQFLQTIKSNTVWQAVKSKVKPVTELSIPIITEVASRIILSKIGI